ncbi:MAG TPA: ABC transporter permease [Bacteroidales bacterium]|nr:ABC transporter permease [Bacteroidales bacterium]
MVKNKLHALVNIIGVAAGMLFFIHLLIYINYESGYESFIRNKDRVYRINYDITQDGERVLHSAKTPRKLFRTVKEEIPEVEYSAQAYIENVLVNYNGHLFSDQQDLWVEGDYPEIFELKMIKGVASINEAYKGIISESKAFEIFGNEDPIGKVLRVNEGMMVEVTGIFEDLPSNSHVKFDYFMPIQTWVSMGVIPPPARENYQGSSWWTYIRLKEGARPEDVEKSLDVLSEKYLTHLERQNRKGKFTLQSLNTLHFAGDRDGELGVSIKEKTVDTMYFISILILIVIWLNYINLSTALSRKRINAFSIYRKIGASKQDLLKLSLIESLIINLSALIIAAALYFSTKELFSKMINVPVTNGNIDYTSVLLLALAVFVGGMIITAILSAIPAMKVNPALTQQEKISRSTGSMWLVGLQFFVSCFLIACSLIVAKQIRFMQDAELGVDLKNVIVLQGAASTHSDTLRRQHFNSFREDVLRQTGFISGTASMNVPGQPVRFRNSNLSAADMKSQLKQEVMVGHVDDGFIQTYGLKLLAGRNFEQPFRNDSINALISKSVCDLLGFASPEDAINRQFRLGNNLLNIKGVVNDFHHEGLKKPIMPMIFQHLHPFEFGYYSFRIEGDPRVAINNLSKVWPLHYPNDPMNYFFSVDFFNDQYKEEKRLKRILSAFTLFSIIISAIGLFGLVSFFTAQRTKEIGLRKVNGATAADIIGMLFVYFFRFEIIAFIFACPMAWIVMKKWLNGFITSTSIGWEVFFFTAVISFAVSTISIASQSFRAATRNPSESLMYE